MEARLYFYSVIRDIYLHCSLFEPGLLALGYFLFQNSAATLPSQAQPTVAQILFTYVTVLG